MAYLTEYKDEIQKLTRCCKIVEPYTYKKDEIGADQCYLLLCFDNIPDIVRFIMFMRYSYEVNGDYAEACPLVADVGDRAPTEYATGIICTIFPDAHGCKQLKDNTMDPKLIEYANKYVCFLMFFPIEHPCPFKERDEHCILSKKEVSTGTDGCYKSKYSCFCTYDEWVLEQNMSTMRRVFATIDKIRSDTWKEKLK